MSEVLSELSGKRATNKRLLLSLIGLLHHCCQAMYLGRPFLRRLIDRAHSVSELHIILYSCLPGKSMTSNGGSI